MRSTERYCSALPHYARTHLILTRPTRCAERTARIAGRVPTIILYKLVAVGLLALMALYTPLWSMPALIAPIFLVRSMCSNCTRALSRSILMDYVPKVRITAFRKVHELAHFDLHHRLPFKAEPSLRRLESIRQSLTCTRRISLHVLAHVAATHQASLCCANLSDACRRYADGGAASTV